MTVQRLGSVKSHLGSDLSLRLAHEPVRPLRQFASRRLFDAEVAIPVAAHLFGDILWTRVGTRTGEDGRTLDGGRAALRPTPNTLHHEEEEEGEGKSALQYFLLAELMLTAKFDFSFSQNVI